MNSIQNHVSSLFSEGDRIVVGVSGGADSMALLHALRHCGKPLHLVAAHLNHCLRGEESERDEQFVVGYCKEHGIPCEIRQIDVAAAAKKSGQSLELCGRELRYAFFEELCGEQGFIATAHTLSDRAETLLFNLARGSSPAGLCSIPAQRGRIVRPLSPFTRGEIEAYCKEYRVPYQIDSSNLSDDYARNRIRRHAVPALVSVNCRFERHAAALMDSLAQDQNYLEQQASAAYKRAERDGRLDARQVARLHPAIQGRVLRLFLESHQIEVSAALVARLVQLCRDGAGRQSVPGNRLVQLRKGFLEIVVPLDRPPYFEYLWDHSEQCDLGGFRIIYCNRQKYKMFTKVYKNFFIYILDYDRIFGNVKIRQRLPQDCLSLPRRGTKSLKKWYNECGVPEQKRWELGVFCDDEGVLGAEGIGVDRRAAAGEQTQHYLLILRFGERHDEG